MNIEARPDNIHHFLEMKDQSQHRQNSLNHQPVIPFAALTQAPVRWVPALLGDMGVREADLSVANLVESNPERADLTDCNILGVSARYVNL
jgi:uncharacterized protein YjbI with pentapeptide repeats